MSHCPIITINGAWSNFGPPFVKWFALCYPTVVLSCLSVTLVYCRQTVGQFKMKLGMQIGLGPGHTVLDGDPAPLPQRGTAPQFSAHICCGQMAGWTKMPLDRKAGLSPQPKRHYVRWGPLPPQKGGRAPQFLAHVYCGQTAGWIKMPLGTEEGLDPSDTEFGPSRH